MSVLRRPHLVCVAIKVAGAVDAGEASRRALPKVRLNLWLPPCKQPSA